MQTLVGGRTRPYFVYLKKKLIIINEYITNIFLKKLARNKYPKKIVSKFVKERLSKYIWIQKSNTNKYANIFVWKTSLTFILLHQYLSRLPSDYNLNSIFDHCHQQNIQKQSLISREIYQKHCPNVFVS